MDEKIKRLFIAGYKLQQAIQTQDQYINATVLDGVRDGWITAHVNIDRRKHQNILRELSKLVGMNQEIKLNDSKIGILKQAKNGRLSVEIIE
jgi:hypothetical protein